MRSLNECHLELITEPTIGMHFQYNLRIMKEKYHRQCIFNTHASLLPKQNTSFTDEGCFINEFVCSDIYQSFDGIAHGGILAAIIDASMAQCLMGYGVAAVTADLSIRYKKSLIIQRCAVLTIQLKDINIGKLYTLEAKLHQDDNLIIEAVGRFFKI